MDKEEEESTIENLPRNFEKSVSLEELIEGIRRIPSYKNLKEYVREIILTDDKDKFGTSTPIQTSRGNPPDSPASMPRKLKSKKREEEEL